MTILEFEEIARQHNFDLGTSSKCELVRAIQQTDGTPPCFNSSSAVECVQFHCIWREDCV